MVMNTKNTALLLIGYQNDYFSPSGILFDKIEDPDIVLKQTITLLDKLIKTDMMIISTPITFSKDYHEFDDPIGVLKLIKDSGAFRNGSEGSQTIPEIEKYGDRITDMPGKMGFDAFEGTHLEELLHQHNIKHLAIAGTIASVCVDSTGRSAFESGFKVIQLSDCISARTEVEHTFYCGAIFPIYSKVYGSDRFMYKLGL